MNEPKSMDALSKSLLWDLALRAGRLSLGQLYTPLEVSSVVRCRGRRMPAHQQGWLLRCHWPSGMFAKAMAKRRAPRLRYAVMKLTGKNVDFLLVVQSLAGWQHRILIPLLGADVRDFLATLKQQPIRVCYSGVSESIMFVEDVPLEMGAAMADLKVCMHVPGQRKAVVRECHDMVTEALWPDFLDGQLAHLGEYSSAASRIASSDVVLSDASRVASCRNRSIALRTGSKVFSWLSSGRIGRDGRRRACNAFASNRTV